VLETNATNKAARDATVSKATTTAIPINATFADGFTMRSFHPLRQTLLVALGGERANLQALNDVAYGADQGGNEQAT
jgi:hypothetical protein